MDKKDKKFTEDFVAKWSKSTEPAPSSVKEEDILKKQESLLQKDPKNARIWYARALVLSDLERFAQALTALNKAESLDANIDGLPSAKAHVLNKLGETGQSALYYRKALLAATKTSQPAIHEAILKTGEPNRLLAEIAAELGGAPVTKTRDAVEADFRGIATVGPLKARSLYEAGFRSLNEILAAPEATIASVKGFGGRNARDIKLAVAKPSVQGQHLTEQECPLCGTILGATEKDCYECGMIFDSKKDNPLEKRLADIEAKLQFDATNTNLWFEKGRILADMGKLREALNALNDVTKLNPSSVEVWNMKAELFEKLGQEKVAASCKKRAEEERAKHAPAIGKDEVSDMLGELEALAGSPAEDWKSEQKKVQAETLRLADEELGLKPISPTPRQLSKTEDEEIDRITHEPITPKARPRPVSRETKPEEDALLDSLTHDVTQARAAPKIQRKVVVKPHETAHIESKTHDLATRKGMTNGLAAQKRGGGMTNGLAKGRTNGLVNGAGKERAAGAPTAW